MEPPSYEEISQQPPALRIEVSNPPAYTSSLPSTPPPAYGDVAVVSQPAPVPIIASCLRESPALVVCPHCQELVTTKIKHVAGKNAWGICMTLSLLFCGFCLIPLAIPRCQDVVHLCPSCKKQIYVFER
uniref:LITAF domain-containing protein n=1 Tax=Oryzias melastigma TaxID=30732 RepID=A0A3B3CYQ1_ORYME